jgi:hypothetical protein
VHADVKEYRRLGLDNPAKRDAFLAQADAATDPLVAAQARQWYERLHEAYNEAARLMRAARARERRAMLGKDMRGERRPGLWRAGVGTSSSGPVPRLIDLFPADVREQLRRYSVGRNTYRRLNLHRQEERAAFVRGDDERGTKAAELARITAEHRLYMQIYNTAAKEVRAMLQPLTENQEAAEGSGKEGVSMPEGLPPAVQDTDEGGGAAASDAIGTRSASSNFHLQSTSRPANGSSVKHSADVILRW